MKNFTVELKDVYPESELFARATVFYEDGHVYEVEDENGRVWPLKELSMWDLQVIEKNLVLNLLADQLDGLEWRPF